MNPRNSRTAPVTRAAVVPLHRGPQAQAPAAYGTAPAFHAPNAALLIDFDNVTMGIRSDLGNELRNLLGSDIIKGKVAVQRAYADWRRYPQYIVPLTEASIDLIYAPAYGASKKNATDIRLAIDAMELVFTRPEIGTIILLSGDSDFSSLVIKLKEYGKYVIGVGIRESSSDLLVMNCDEYYSYNALAGLVKSNEEEIVKHDPWELVVEAVTRMKRNGDVMRSDRLKQVMQELDPSFDEKNLGMAKFSKFAQEASQRGLIRVSKLENGQMEVDVAGESGGRRERAPERAAERSAEGERANGEERGRRGRRGGRGRGREREPRERAAPPRESAVADVAPEVEEAEAPRHFAPPIAEPTVAPPEATGERLTRDEAFDLVRRAVAALARDDEAVPASDVRHRVRELLGRDSESLNERFFQRILRDAHDADVIDLRKRGDDYEVARAAEAEPVAAQLSTAAAPSAPTAAPSQAARAAANAASLRRGIRGRGRAPMAGELPPELLSVGVVDVAPAPVADVAPTGAAPEQGSAAEPAPKRRRGATKSGGRGRKTARVADGATAPSGAAEEPKARRTRARKKSAASSGSEG